MKTIWKYDVEVVDRFSLEMPSGAEIITVQTQTCRRPNGPSVYKPVLWALHEVRSGGQSTTETRNFRVFGTGHEVSSDKTLKYIGTFQLYYGDFVGHLFEELK